MAYADIDSSDKVGTVIDDEGFELYWEVRKQDSAKIVELDVKWKILGNAYDITMHAVYTDDIDRGYSFEL